MRIVGAGFSGFIGGRLTSALTSAGHDVVRLVRRPARGPDELSWDPDARRIPEDALAGADAVVNLCGVGIGDHRWTESYQALILSSRLNPTGLLAREAARHEVPVMISASGVDYYADQGSKLITEDSPRGRGYLPDVCEQWERAADPARDAGTRVAHLRTGPVVGQGGGLLPKLELLTKLLINGRLGSGRQYWPLISIDDQVGGIAHLLTAPVAGPVNMTGPYPMQNAEFTALLADFMHRPAPWIIPGFAVRAAVGGFAETILASHRAVPIKLRESGYEFVHPTVESMLRAAVD